MLVDPRKIIEKRWKNGAMTGIRAQDHLGTCLNFRAGRGGGTKPRYEANDEDIWHFLVRSGVTLASLRRGRGGMTNDLDQRPRPTTSKRSVTYPRPRSFIKTHAVPHSGQAYGHGHGWWMGSADFMFQMGCKLLNSLCRHGCFTIVQAFSLECFGGRGISQRCAFVRPSVRPTPAQSSRGPWIETGACRGPGQWTWGEWLQVI